MTRRVDPRKAPRPFYRFPWTPEAVKEAVSLATITEREPTLRNLSYREIAEQLVGRGLVTHRPDAATVARMLLPELAKRRALAELAKGAA